jgi:hypothetical protein
MKVLKEDFYKAYNSNNYIDARTFLSNCLLWNSEDIDTIRECANKLENIEGVFELHNGKYFSNAKNNWNQAYLEQLNADLTLNFSKERYMHAVRVANYLQQAETGNAPVKKKVEYKKVEKQGSFKGIALIAALLVIVLIVYAVMK